MGEGRIRTVRIGNWFGTSIPVILVALLSLALIRLLALLRDTRSPLLWLVALAPFWIAIVAGFLSMRDGMANGWSEALPNSRAATPVGVFYLLLATSLIRAGTFQVVSATETFGHLLLWGTVLGFAAVILALLPGVELHYDRRESHPIRGPSHSRRSFYAIRPSRRL